ncbi:MAG: 2-deoxyribose-5-phosphate aldolase [Gammaproteobacteria bacterium]|jgi:deoxyribose-phosphate aldolase|nr:2-deoxyribose-5-phosphate aldolase [Gammaproteobacteria bacterium]
MTKSLINEWVAAAQMATASTDLTKKIISVIDLTSLNDTDDKAAIDALCTKALTPLGQVAAVCVYPQFVQQAKTKLLNTNIKVATVANFPQGNATQQVVLAEIGQAVASGADEVDVVIPYQAYLANRAESVEFFLRNCKQACGHAKLKVILETGALQAAELIANACQDAIQAGADFLKTSTGKVAVGATLEAAAVMLLAIKNARSEGKSVGFKASGGIRTPEQAVSYISLAELILGENWLSSATFRFGASGLLDALLAGEINQSTY